MKKFEHTLIASDIDGTILWEAGYIHPRNFERLRYFTENGGHFALSTGRNHKDIFAIMENLGALVNMPCILCNGSYLFDIQSGEIMNPHYLESEPFMALLRRVRDTFGDQVGFRASFKDGFMVADDDAYILRELKGYNLHKLANRRPLPEIAKEKLFKAVFISAPEMLSHVKALAESEFSAYFTFTTSAPHIFEIQPKGISKHSQFPYLKKLYGGAKIWAIGDFNNDMEMLMGADESVCPENAVDDIKKIARHRVCHCKDGALAELVDLIEASFDKA